MKNIFKVLMTIMAITTSHAPRIIIHNPDPNTFQHEILDLGNRRKVLVEINNHCFGRYRLLLHIGPERLVLENQTTLRGPQDLRIAQSLLIELVNRMIFDANIGMRELPPRPLNPEELFLHTLAAKLISFAGVPKDLYACHPDPNLLRNKKDPGHFHNKIPFLLAPGSEPTHKARL